MKSGNMEEKQYININPTFLSLFFCPAIYLNKS